jgi:hypothetical protein
MPSINIHRTPRGRNRPDRPQKSGGPAYIPPPARPGQRPETLDRRIRNLSTLGNGVFTGNVLASYMALPGLVGFWPMSSVQRSTGNAYDLSGQGRTLTYNGNPAYTYYNGLVPYLDFDGTGDYLSRADETDLDILGNESIFTSGAAGLTMGAWCWADAIGSNQAIITKDDTTNRSYSLYIGTGGGAIVEVFGASTGTVTSTDVLTAATWYFVVARYIPSTSVDVFVNNSKTTSTSTIPASLTNSTAALQVGARNASLLLNGRLSLVFLCANNLGDDLISSTFEVGRILYGV